MGTGFWARIAHAPTLASTEGIAAPGLRRRLGPPAGLWSLLGAHHLSP